jgi:hypothetical protein
MSSDNPFNDAMDDAEAETTDSQDGADFDLDEFVAGLNEGPKSETIGVAVSEDMHAVWKELRRADDVDVDVAESIRNHLENLAQRHEKAAERAGRKLQIDRELRD